MDKARPAGVVSSEPSLRTAMASLTAKQSVIRPFSAARQAVSAPSAVLRSSAAQPVARRAAIQASPAATARRSLVVRCVLDCDGHTYPHNSHRTLLLLIPSRAAHPKPPSLSLPALSAMAAPAVAKSIDGLQAPHGGKLISLQTPKAEWDAVIKSATKTLEASDRNACDVELLSVG